MASTSSPKVDVENRVIKDVIMTQAAKEASGHGFGIEAEFVEKMVEFATGKLKNRVSANFGHNWDNMGKQLGYFTNIRMEGEKALGDLHIFQSADLSPLLPNMGEWLLSLSQEDNSRLNASIKFSVDYYYQLDKAGNKYKVWYWDDKEGWISPSKALGSIFAAFKDLISTDIVEKGAVTDRLFSEDTLYQRFHDIIAEPGFSEMLAENEENFPQLTDHFMQKGNHGIFQALKRFFTKQNTIMAENHTETPAQETTEQRFERIENLIQELSAQITPPADTQPAPPAAQETNFAEQIQALQAELAELKKAPAAEHTAGVTTETDDTPAFMDLDIHEKARAFKN
jgi:hypothetical protein